MRMRSLLTLVFLCALVAGAHAQSRLVTMSNDKVLLGDSVCFVYKKLGTAIYNSPIDKGAPISNHNAHPEANGDAFQDIVFGTEHQFLIKAKAQLLASARYSFLVYFYNIQFTSLGKEMNVQYHPLLMQSLAKDMVKYKVIEDGFLNEKGVNKLMAKWKKKPGYINQQQLEGGVINNYNVSKISPKEKTENTINVTVKGNDIYRNDTLVGHYKKVNNVPIIGWAGSTKNSNLYKIEGLQDELLAWVKAPLLQPVYHLMPSGYKSSFEVVTTERNEQRIIASAMKVLIVLRKEKEVAKN